MPNLFIDATYYTDIYKGKIPSIEIEANLEIALIQCNDICYGRIKEGLSDATVLIVKKALCFQADYVYKNGGADAGTITGWSVEGLSISQEGSNSRRNISEYAYLLLKSTHLLSRIL